MFIDEFTINRKTLNTYGWTRRGLPERLLIRTLEFKMSFIVAHSQIRIDALWGQKTVSIRWNIRSSCKSCWQRLRKTQKLIWISSSSSQIIEFFSQDQTDQRLCEASEVEVIAYSSVLAWGKCLRKVDKLH